MSQAYMDRRQKANAEAEQWRQIRSAMDEDMGEEDPRGRRS